MGFEVMAKYTPVQHSSLQIEVVVLDSAATYDKSGAWSVYMVNVDAGILLKTVRWPREGVVMADIRQLLRLQGWKDGYDRWSQSQDFTDFDQCIVRPKDGTRDSVNKKCRKPAVSHWNTERHLYVRSVVGAESENSDNPTMGRAEKLL